MLMLDLEEEEEDAELNDELVGEDMMALCIQQWSRGYRDRFS